MTVEELIAALEHHEHMGGDLHDNVAIWHDGSDAKLIITDSVDKNKQTIIMEDK